MIKSINEWQNQKYNVLYFYDDEDLLRSFSITYPNIHFSKSPPSIVFNDNFNIHEFDFIFTGLKSREKIIDFFHGKLPIVCYSAIVTPNTINELNQNFPKVLFIEKPADIHSYQFLKTINEYLKNFNKQ